MKTLLILATLMFSITSFANCTDDLGSNPQPRAIALKDGTGAFLGYLAQLHQERIVTDAHLRRLADAISQKHEIVNPIPSEARGNVKLFESTIHQIHYDGFEDYLKNSDLDPKKILTWVQGVLQTNAEIQEKRCEVREETADLHLQIEFLQAKGGDFEMSFRKPTLENNPYVKVRLNLTHAIEAMTTPVTQKMWFELMGENPSKFSSGENTIEVFRNGQHFKVQPNHPVENITWYSAVVFANRLSEKMGLSPAYDLRQMNIRAGTRAEDGSLIASGITLTGYDIYRSPGYRLPTEYEQELLIQQAKSGVTMRSSENFIFYMSNSGSRTHAVDELPPLNGFFSLLGNVQEWTNTWTGGWTDYAPKAGENDPTGPYSGVDRALRGGHWGSSELALHSQESSRVSPDQRNGHTGFRLVRTLP